MKKLIMGILSFSIVFAATTALAIDDATVQAIDEKAASANAKADGNNSRIQALEEKDVVILEKVNKIKHKLHRVYTELPSVPL